MTIILALLLLPFLQIGLTYYVSVQTFALVLIFATRERLRLLATPRVVAGFFIAYLMVAQTMLFPGAQNSDILRAARQGLCLLLMLGILGSSQSLTFSTARKVLPILVVLASAQLLLMLIQVIMISRYTYFGLPKDLFVMNAGTLPSELDLIYSKIRASGTFGEPSFLGALCASLVLVIIPLWRDLYKARIVIVLLTAATFLSMSMLGVAVVTAALVSSLLRSDLRWGLAFGVSGALIALGASSYIIESSLWMRMGNIFSGDDLSANARIFAPLHALPSLISIYPFGIPSAIFSQLTWIPGIQIPPSSLLHNGLFTLISAYGFTGIAIIAILLIISRDNKLRLILLVQMIQNGDGLSFNKVVIIAFVVLLHNTVKAQKISQLRSAPSHRYSASGSVGKHQQQVS